MTNHEILKRGQTSSGKYNWVDAYIESLDPNTEYDEIVRVVTLYRGSEFLVNIDYVTNSIKVIQEAGGASAMSCSGKTIKHPQKRFEDTLEMFRIWFANGSSSKVTTEAMGRLNKYHMSIAPKVPGVFNADDEFIWAVVLMGVSSHLMQKKLGFPGFTPELQTAWFIFCSGVIKLFEKENGGPVTGFPSSYEGMLDFSKRMDNRPYKPTAQGKHIAELLIKQFVDRWSPFAATDFIFREIILTFLPTSTIELHGLGRRRPWLEACIVLFFQMKFLLIFLLPDPQQPTLPARVPHRPGRK